MAFFNVFWVRKHSSLLKSAHYEKVNFWGMFKLSCCRESLGLICMNALAIEAAEVDSKKIDRCTEMSIRFTLKAVSGNKNFFIHNSILSGVIFYRF
jgi:hypothetical protein